MKHIREPLAAALREISERSAKPERPDLTPDDFGRALAQLGVRLLRNRDRHGPRPYASRSLTYQALQEEFIEVEECIRRGDGDGDLQDELLDLAAAALWEAATILREEA